MADQEQSTEQPLSQVSEVFRESFVALFERPDHEAALRLVAEVVQDVVFEGRNALLTAESRRETNIRRACRGGSWMSPTAGKPVSVRSVGVREPPLPQASRGRGCAGWPRRGGDVHSRRGRGPRAG